MNFPLRILSASRRHRSAAVRFSPGGRKRGFTLIVTTVLMTLLLVLSMGMLSLSSISLRASGAGDAMAEARANARLALALALNELQLELGDDRRVTADAALLDEASPRPHLTGVWNSAEDEHPSQPLKGGIDYDSKKREGFRRWLVSHPSATETAKESFASRPRVSQETAQLFSESLDGFDLYADLVPVDGETNKRGALAWAISQEATKAGINVGAHLKRLADHDVIQAPDRPNLSLSGIANHPEENWDLRPAKVMNLRQAALDSEYGLDKLGSARLGREHTALSRGVQVDVVKGGLKTDLSLAFELDEGDFKATSWDGIRNPFAGGTGLGGEVRLYETVTRQEPVEVNFVSDAINLTHSMNTGMVPTFQSLRSYYRLAHHVYGSASGPAAYFRAAANPGYRRSAASRGSEVAVSPVLDRVLFFFSVMVTSQRVPVLVITPVITLWNPYNVALEAEGFVVYPWRDIPMYMTWQGKRRSDPEDWGWTQGQWLSTTIGLGFDGASHGTGHGRQLEPYFLCKLTASGSNNVSQPLRLEPGEVKVFVPSAPIPPTPPTQNVFSANSEEKRSIFMAPMGSGGVTKGGILVPLNRDSWGNHPSMVILDPNSPLRLTLRFDRHEYPYFVSMEDATRIKNPVNHAPGTIPALSEVQVVGGSRGMASVTSPDIQVSSIVGVPQPVAVLETFHRTAGQPNEESDIVYTVNPRGRYTNSMISGMSDMPNSHYDSQLNAVGGWETERLQTKDGRAFYGLSNSAGSGRDCLPFYELPREPMLSLAGFQHADLSDSAFAPGSQFGNSWASAYVPRRTTARVVRSAVTDIRENRTSPLMPDGLGLYDHSYLLNAALWDGYFFSSIAPELSPGTRPAGSDPYATHQARVVRGIDKIVEDWVRNPQEFPLRNPRHLLHRGGLEDDEIKQRLVSPAGCRQAAGHLLVDGAFNVNSVHESAWAAVLASLRGSSFEVEADRGGGETYRSGKSTPVPRMRRPWGKAGDPWSGFRELSDEEIQGLAKEIVKEVRERGPFQSLAEFVNRRLSDDEKGLKGALQAAIDRSGLNDRAKIVRFNAAGYPEPGNLPDPNTGTGTPGWLTQADLLNALAPFITVRSDTFTVRAYGEARDSKGKVTARAWCEAVVQRLPEWVDGRDAPHLLPDELAPTNARFGRRFEVISYRQLFREELEILPARYSS